jgi:hypothetical protein
MPTIDDEIDALYRGPLDAFTDGRNALAKAAKRPDVKALAKPSLPAWAVNQLYWHQRPVLDRLLAASTAVRAQHQRMLAGEPADVRTAEQTHREALREAVTAAKDVLSAAHQAATPATLESIRETLQALPSPEANGRLVRPLSPQGLEALAGLVLAARPGPIAMPLPVPVPKLPAASTTTAASAKTPAASARDEVARERAAAKARAEAEKAAREKAARRKAAEAAVARARTALEKADEAVLQAERDLATRQAERVAARETLKRAQREAEELSFGR